MDALPPNVLNNLITSAIEEVRDRGRYLEITKLEDEDRTKLRKALNDLRF